MLTAAFCLRTYRSVLQHSAHVQIFNLYFTLYIVAVYVAAVYVVHQMAPVGDSRSLSEPPVMRSYARAASASIVTPSAMLAVTNARRSLDRIEVTRLYSTLLLRLTSWW